jgi:hypothetical protein
LYDGYHSLTLIGDRIGTLELHWRLSADELRLVRTIKLTSQLELAQARFIARSMAASSRSSVDKSSSMRSPVRKAAAVAR